MASAVHEVTPAEAEAHPAPENLVVTVDKPSIDKAFEV